MLPNISCFLNGKVRFVVCLCIFYKNFWVKSKGTILFTNLFYLGWKENSLKIDWDSVGRGAFRENCYDFNEMAAIPKLLSLLNRSLEGRRLSAERKYFFLYYRWNVQDKNKLFWSLYFSFCVFIFRTLKMTCYDTEDNAGLYRFIPNSKTITIIVISFLFYTSYFTGIYNNLKLCFSLTDTAVKNG